MKWCWTSRRAFLHISLIHTVNRTYTYAINRNGYFGNRAVREPKTVKHDVKGLLRLQT